jgi:pyruvate kinase
MPGRDPAALDTPLKPLHSVPPSDAAHDPGTGDVPGGCAVDRTAHTPASADVLLAAVGSLRDAAVALERESAADLERALPTHRRSVANLLHYLALRRLDLRELQDRLGRIGLSSLGRMEAHVLASLDAVAAALRALAGQGGPVPPAARHCPFEAGDARLAAGARRAFGDEPAERHTRIMVTLPTAAADDPDLIPGLLAAGMNLARINAAHDDVPVWCRMVARVRAAEAALGRSCRIAFDLAGPKLRTGPVEPGEAVLKCRPRRDALGRVLAPAEVRLVPDGPDRVALAGELPVGAALLRRLRAGDSVDLVDARGRRRTLAVTSACEDGTFRCALDRTAYLVPGTALVHRRGRRVLAGSEVGALPAAPGAIVLRPGDRLDLVQGTVSGRGARPLLDGRVGEPARIGCDEARLFERLRPGERVLFDDGTITTVVREVSPQRAVLHVQHCAGGVAALRADKGINVPDTRLDLPAMTARDEADLAFAVGHADLVSASFIQRPEDVDRLREALEQAGRSDIAIVLKVETAQAFARLPELLMAGLRHPVLAVMAARGDLAVEVGFERLAEVQEEILWLCEAAHVPVIWATQVLDSLARDGLPSRAEVTDAATSGRAECVMLNKGPFIRETLAFLDGVLTRMQAHQRKKTAMLRRLQVSDWPARAGAPDGQP